jgi:hypothetical protein
MNWKDTTEKRWYFLTVLVTLTFGVMILLISMIRFGLEKTLSDDRLGIIRKRQIEVVMSIGPDGSRTSEFYNFPDSGMLPSNPWYGVKEARDWLWVRFTSNLDNKINLIMLMADKKMAEAELFLKQNEPVRAIKASREAIDKLKYTNEIWRQNNPNGENEGVGERIYLAGFVYEQILKSTASENIRQRDDFRQLINDLSKWNGTQKNKKI